MKGTVLLCDLDRFRDHLVSFCEKASGADGPKPTSRERGWGKLTLKPSQPTTAGGWVSFPFFCKEGWSIKLYRSLLCTYLCTRR